MSDYLAIIYIGGGSTHGRAPDKEKAITLALKYVRDWRALFEVSNIPIIVNVIDVQGYGDVSWGVGGLEGRNEETGAYEKIDRPVSTTTRRTPRIRRSA